MPRPCMNHDYPLMSKGNSKLSQEENLLRERREMKSEWRGVLFTLLKRLTQDDFTWLLQVEPEKREGKSLDGSVDVRSEGRRYTIPQTGIVILDVKGSIRYWSSNRQMKSFHNSETVSIFKCKRLFEIVIIFTPNLTD